MKARHRLPRRRLGAGLLAATVLAIGGGVTVAALGSDPAPAHADALCDQMRAQYGSNWPCISVPTNTFQPTTNTPAPTTGANGAGSGGPQVGSNIGPGPGEGNGTPIVTVPGQAAPQPPAAGGNGSGPTNPNTAGVRPTAPQPVPPGDTTGQIPVVPSAAVPAVTTVPGAATANPEPGTPPHALDSGSKQPEIPLAAWVVAGAAAFAAANPRARQTFRGLGNRFIASDNVERYDETVQDLAYQNPELPGSPLVNTPGSQSAGNIFSTTRVILDQEAPEGFVDPNMSSALAKQWGGTIQLHPDDHPELVGPYSGNLIKPNPQEGPLGTGDTAARLPGWTVDEQGNRRGGAIEINAVKGAKLRCISATPIGLRAVDVFGKPRLGIVYQYQYQVEYTYTFQNNSIVYFTKWANISQQDVLYLQSQGVGVPVPP